MLVFLPPQLTATPLPFNSTRVKYFPIHRYHHHAISQLPPSTAASSSSFSSARPIIIEDGPNDILSLQNRSYDFTPLLNFLSNDSNSNNNNNSLSPTSLNSTEFELAESYRAVPAPLWHALLKSLCSSPSSINLAYDVVTWLQKHNLCFSYELLYSILIHALGRNEKLYEAFLLSQQQVLTPLTYNALISACARNGDVEKALNLMSRMRRDGFQPDFINYSSIIKSLTRSNRIDSPFLQKLYAEIESDKIEPDGHLLNDIILGFSKAGDATRAMHFLAVAQGKGLSPKPGTLVSVILALGNLGRTVEAEALFEEIKENGLEPRTRAYNAVLRGHVKTGSLKDAEFVVSQMETCGVLPDEYTYSLLVDAYTQAGRWESARIVLKEMEASNLQPNSFIYSRMLASYRDKGEWQKSFQVLKEMKSCGVQPDRHFYNVMIDTFGKYNCIDHAMATFERMLSEGIRPDTVTWNTLIDCHCKSGRHQRAEELFEEMQQSGYSPCVTTYNIMINSMGVQERWEQVSDLLSRMKSQGLLPNVAEPLIHASKVEQHHHPWMVYFTTFIAVCGSYEFGACAGYSSPTQDAIRKDLNLSLAEYSLFGSILTFGAMIGAITSGPIADFVGRKGAMRVSSAFCIAGWLVIYFSEGPVPLDIGRLATGYGMGVFSFVVPVFVAEIAPKELRGALTTLNQFMIVTAVSVSFIIGTVLSWRALAIIGLIPTAVLLLGLFFIPESPRWLAKRGRAKDFVAALQILRGKDTDISQEAEEIQDYITSLEQLAKPKMLDLFQRRYLRSLTIGIGLMVCQQLGGINGVCFYTSSIFDLAGFPSTTGSIIYAILQIVITGVGAALIDKAGRKPLLLVSGSGLVAGCIFTAVAFYLKVHDVAVEAVPALALTGILVYIGSFSIGMGAIPWVVMSEIFPVNIKGQAGSLATLVNWFGAWLCSYTFNFLMSWSSYGTFVLYAAINALAILFIVLVVPETKGKSLEQLQAAINA